MALGGEREKAQTWCDIPAMNHVVEQRGSPNYP